MTLATHATASPSALKDLLALTKPRLSSLVVFTAGGGLLLADRAPSWTLAFGAVVGTTLVVAGANVLNCYLERASDGLMARTRTRPLPTGRLQPSAALWFGLLLAVPALPLIALLANPVAALLAALGLVLYVMVYTPLKRVTSFATVIGAVPGALPPLIGHAAGAGTIALEGLVLFALLFVWQIPHFLAIGLYRKDEYARAGMPVLPVETTDEITREQIVLYLAALVPLTISLYPLGIGGTPTLVVGSLLAFWFFAIGLDGWRHKRGAVWARKLFRASLVYLSGLFAILCLTA